MGNVTPVPENKQQALQRLATIVKQVGAPLRDDGLSRSVAVKRDGSFVTQWDTRIQNELRARLEQEWPDIPLVGEEMPAAERDRILQSGADRFWCLDPLDGTTNFSSGFPVFAISLALMAHGVAELGVVYDPSRDECFTALRGGGAFLNDVPLHTSSDATTLHCIACVDFKRLARTLAEHLVAQPPYKSQRNLGATTLEWCWLAADRVQLYLHGGQNLWDYAAGSLILNEAGGRAVTLAGVEIPDPESNQHRRRKVSVVAASNPALLEMWWSWIAERAELVTLYNTGPQSGSG